MVTIATSRMGMILALVLGTVGCGDGPQARVALVSPPVLTGLVFHGNCVALWLLEATVRVSAGREEALILDRFAFHFTEGALTAGDTLDGRQLRERFGDDAQKVAAGGSRDYRLGILWPTSTARQVTLGGEVSGLGESGPLLEGFSFPDLPVVASPLGPGLGACS